MFHLLQAFHDNVAQGLMFPYGVTMSALASAALSPNNHDNENNNNNNNNGNKKQPSEFALLATPEAYRSDHVIQVAQDAAATGHCTSSVVYSFQSWCQVAFDPIQLSIEQGFSVYETMTRPAVAKIGVIVFGADGVDPRAYSPLAHILAVRYGLPTVIPILEHDPVAAVASTEQDDRLSRAQVAFPGVEKWIFVGHSERGGTAAVEHVGQFLDQGALSWMDRHSPVGGLVLLSSSHHHNHNIDLSRTSLPVASVSAGSSSNDPSHEDDGLNSSSRSSFLQLPKKTTFLMNLAGGDQDLFADSHQDEHDDTTPRVAAQIPPILHWDFATSAIYNVAARTGLPLPQPAAAVTAATSFTRTSSKSNSRVQTDKSADEVQEVFRVPFDVDDPIRSLPTPPSTSHSPSEERNNGLNMIRSSASSTTTAHRNVQYSNQHGWNNQSNHYHGWMVVIAVLLWWVRHHLLSSRQSA